MESLNLEMDDIFDRGADDAEDDQEDYGLHPALPDLDADETVMRPEADQNEEDEVLANLKNLSKGAAKKKVLRPQPKLNPERLKSERGLPALTKLFNDTQFQGKGYEAEDLKLMMGKLEHWAHRLFPKMPFDEFVERLEKLGAKKEVQNCVKRIRLDMPILDDDFVMQNEEAKESDNEPPVQDLSDDDTVTNAEHAYDEMILREQEAPVSHGNVLNSPAATQPVPLPSTPSSLSEGPSVSKSPPSCVQKTSESVTAEQLKRMEQNRLLALQKREQRLGKPLPATVLPVPSSSLSLSQNTSDKPSSYQASGVQNAELEGLEFVNGDSHLANAQESSPCESRVGPAVRDCGRSPGADGGVDLPEKMNETEQETMQTEDEILESLNF